jgi:hypothetical protein
VNWKGAVVVVVVVEAFEATETVVSVGVLVAPEAVSVEAIEMVAPEAVSGEVAEMVAPEAVSGVVTEMVEIDQTRQHAFLNLVVVEVTAAEIVMALTALFFANSNYLFISLYVKLNNFLSYFF